MGALRGKERTSVVLEFLPSTVGVASTTEVIKKDLSKLNLNILCQSFKRISVAQVRLVVHRDA